MIDRWKLYDLIYAKADKLLKQYNPCNIRVENDKLVCNNDYMCKKYGENLCCEGCGYLRERGCTTRCLGCKVGMCWEGDNTECTIQDRLQIKIPKEFVTKMERLRKITYKYNLYRIQMSKNELFIEQELVVY